MNTSSLEMRLDFSRHWDREKQTWRLPIGAGSDLKNYTLRYNGKTVPPDAYVGVPDGLRMVQEQFFPKPATKVLCDVNVDPGVKVPCPKFSQSLILALVGVIPAVLTFIATCYFKDASGKDEPVPNHSAAAQAKPEAVSPAVEPNILNGKPLAAMDQYPVVDDNGILKIDSEKFMAAVKLLLEFRNTKATADLIYLEKANNFSRDLTKTERELFEKLKKEVPVPDFKEQEIHRDRMFSVFKQIVDGIGQTFAGTPVEIVLHDVRNPLKSVVAVQNTISGRYPGCPTTNFGIELIKWYAPRTSEGASFISYSMRMKTGKRIKSTTVPLYDQEYGLIGFVCMNIAIEDIPEPRDADPLTLTFLKNFKATIPQQTKIDEMIDAAGLPPVEEKPAVIGTVR